MVLGRQLRSAFTPEALSTFNHTMDEVCTELLADGLLHRQIATRIKLGREWRGSLLRSHPPDGMRFRLSNSCCAHCVTNVPPLGPKQRVASGRIHKFGWADSAESRRGDLTRSAAAIGKHL
jgi:hypothetical protein